jgi:regulator of protease activity HflC (stomatin/prohibitin superfamily)
VDRALGWIGEIFQTLLKLVPWLVIVPATHGGVAFARGHQIKEWKPGLHWYWPVATTYKLIMVVRQTQLIQTRIIMTKDKQTVMVGALVTYYIDDVVAAVAQIADLASDVMERSQGAIFSCIAAHTLDEVHADRADINRELTERVGTSLNGYGVKVLQAQLTEFAPCRAFALSSRSTVGNYNLWTGF